MAALVCNLVQHSSSLVEKLRSIEATGAKEPTKELPNLFILSSICDPVNDVPAPRLVSSVRAIRTRKQIGYSYSLVFVGMIPEPLSTVTKFHRYSSTFYFSYCFKSSLDDFQYLI